MRRAWDLRLGGTCSCLAKHDVKALFKAPNRPFKSLVLAELNVIGVQSDDGDSCWLPGTAKHGLQNLWKAGDPLCRRLGEGMELEYA